MLFMFFVFFSCITSPISFFFFFFNDTATTEIYTLSLHDALPIFGATGANSCFTFTRRLEFLKPSPSSSSKVASRSEEHTSELQSPCNLVCRLLLEKKKKIILLVTSCLNFMDTIKKPTSVAFVVHF